MTTELHGGFNRVRGTLLRLAQTAKEMPNEEKNADFKDTMVENVKRMIELDERTFKIMHVFDKLYDDIENRGKFPEVLEHDKMKIEMDKVKVDSKNLEKGNRETMENIIEEIVSGEDEMVVMDVQYSKKDPISKKDIEKPVKADKCHHVYDHDSIIQFANSKRLIDCAVQGCKAKITIAKLKEFPEFFDLCQDN